MPYAPVPSQYVCFVCKVKGDHWIMDCALKRSNAGYTSQKDKPGSTYCNHQRRDKYSGKFKHSTQLIQQHNKRDGARML